MSFCDFIKSVSGKKIVVRKNRPEELNNKGLSLIELLIAIAILSIVVVVFYEGFIVSAKVNSKAKVQHQATSLAQDIMEAFKSQDMDKLMMQFEHPYVSFSVGGSDYSYRNFELLPDLINGAAFDDPSHVKDFIGTYATKSKDEDGHDLTSYIDEANLHPVYDADTDSYIYQGKYVTTKDGKYYLYLQNLVMEKRVYDAVITLDGLPYKEDTDNGNVIASGQGYNNNEVVQLPNMDAQYDVISSNSTVFDAEAEAQLQSIANDDNFSVSNISREILIQIEESQNLMSFFEQKVMVAYNYTYTYAVGAKAGQQVKLNLHKDYPFDNTVDLDVSLRNVYLFYDPRKDYKEDKIKIVRAVYPADKRQDLDVYIVKLLPHDYESIGLAWDDMYHPVFELEERETLSGAAPVSPSVFDEPSIYLHTNIGYYMTRNAMGEFPKMSHCQMTSNGISLGFLYNGVPKTDVEGMLHTTSLTNKAALERIYDIQIDVFLHEDDTFKSYDDFKDMKDAGEAKASLSSTIRN